MSGDMFALNVVKIVELKGHGEIDKERLEKLKKEVVFDKMLKIVAILPDTGERYLSTPLFNKS